MHVAALYRYPLKSAAASAAAELTIEPRGAQGDRRWMLVDPEGHFITGRQLPALVRLRAEWRPQGLRLQWHDEVLEVATPAAESGRRRVQVWKDWLEVPAAAAEANAWLSQRLGRAVELVQMDEQTRRTVDPRYGRADDEVSFADSFPLLVVTQSAVDELGRRAGRALDVRRFRPNIVVADAAPHAEDGWHRLRIGGIEFEAAKPCTRCVFTTVDPDRGERDDVGEPLRTLRQYRRLGDGVSFGLLLIPRGRGGLRVGAEVEVMA